MKLILWEDKSESWAFRPPPLIVKEEGSVLEFHDYTRGLGLEIGDRIHYHTSVGTTQFEVTEVHPANLPNYPPDLNLVTARKKET